MRNTKYVHALKEDLTSEGRIKSASRLRGTYVWFW